MDFENYVIGYDGDDRKGEKSYKCIKDEEEMEDDYE